MNCTPELNTCLHLLDLYIGLDFWWIRILAPCLQVKVQVSCAIQFGWAFLDQNKEKNNIPNAKLVNAFTYKFSVGDRFGYTLKIKGTWKDKKISKKIRTVISLQHFRRGDCISWPSIGKPNFCCFYQQVMPIVLLQQCCGRVLGCTLFGLQLLACFHALWFFPLYS